MQLVPTAIAGAFRIERQPVADARGSFARTFCVDAFAAAGIDFRIAQMNLSRNPHVHTLRGLHGQQPLHEEAKLVQCVRGRIFDVAVDVRPDSPSRGRWVGVELAGEGETSFYIPPGCLHGFLTLEPDSDVLYHMGTAFVAGVGIGARFDDPAFGIAWPAAPAVISDRDASYPDFAI
jgi:dTDP-4-dehydrorhamnose 3,5-epimerase